MGVLLTRRQAGEIIGVTHDTIRYWHVHRDLKHHTQRHGFRNRYYIDSDELVAFAEKNGLYVNQEKLSEFSEVSEPELIT